MADIKFPRQRSVEQICRDLVKVTRARFHDGDYVLATQAGFVNSHDFFIGWMCWAPDGEHIFGRCGDLQVGPMSNATHITHDESEMLIRAWESVMSRIIRE